MKKPLLLSIFLIGILVILIYISLIQYVMNQAVLSTVKKSDVILTLGARSYIDGEYNPCLIARVDHAVDLYKEDYAPKLLMSGGTDKEDNINEAETMKKMAIAKGVPQSDILLEKKATSTYENFTLSKKIMNENDLHSVIIVTEPFHIARATLVARKLNLNQTQSPAKDSPCWIKNKSLSTYNALKEPLAILTYKLQNKL